jgi:hypothetical protein
MADFYSLTRLLHAIREEGKTVTAHDSARNALAGELLRDFGRGVDEVNDRTSLASQRRLFRSLSCST